MALEELTKRVVAISVVLMRAHERETLREKSREILPMYIDEIVLTCENVRA